MLPSVFTDLPRATNANGQTLSGAKWFFYFSGTTTLANIYTTSALNTYLANPVIADSGGKFANIYFDTDIPLRAVQTDAGGTVIRDIDPISGGLSANLNAIIQALATGTIAGLIGKFYATKALMNADLVPASGVFALVYNDSTALNNDLYIKSGATGTGSWSATGLISGAAQAYATAAAASATAAAGSATAAATSASVAANATIPGFNALTQHNPNLAVTVTQGVYVNKSTGAVVSLAGLETFSGPCVAGTTIRFNRTTPFNSAGLAYFTAANAYISGGDYTAFADSTVPANATNFKISLSYPAFYDQTGTADPQYTFHAWDTAQPAPTDYQAPGYVDPYQASKRANAVVRSHRPARDYYDPDTTIKDTIRYTNGGSTSLAGTDTLAFSPCEYGRPFYFSHAWVISNPQFGIAWADHAGNIIGGSGAIVTANLSGTTLTVTAINGANGRLSRGLAVYHANYPNGKTYITNGPEEGGTGAYTVNDAASASATGQTINACGYPANVPVYPIKGAGQFSTSLSATNRYLLRISDQPFASLTDFRGVIGFSDLRSQFPFRNKVGALLGDSIVWSQGTGDQRFAYQLERELRTTWGMIRPIPGWDTTQILGATSGSGNVAVRGTDSALVSGDFSAIDFVFSNAGINDWGHARTLGALGDTTTGTIYGSMYDTYVAKLQTWKPTMRIFLATPIPNFTPGASGDVANGNPTNSIGVKVSDIATAIRATAGRFGFGVVDYAALGLGFNAVNWTNYLNSGDGTHPGNAGYDRMIPLTAGEMNRLGRAY